MSVTATETLRGGEVVGYHQEYVEKLLGILDIIEIHELTRHDDPLKIARELGKATRNELMELGGFSAGEGPEGFGD